MQVTEKQLNIVASLFSILSDPVRLRILQCIQDCPRSVGSIMRRCSLKQANTSKHLRVLRDAKIVSTDRKGTTIYYRISEPLVMELCELVCKSQKMTPQKNKTFLSDKEFKIRYRPFNVRYESVIDESL